MDTRDKFWIFAAGAVALASIALSAFIVAFAPEDPYMRTSAAVHSDHAFTPAENRRFSESARRPVSDAPGEAATGNEEIRDARSDGRLAYAAGGATAAIAMMFAVIGWLDRGEMKRAIEGGCLATEARPIATLVGSPALAPPGPHDADDAEVSATVAMIALGFGAFVGRSHAPVPQQLSVASNDRATRREERPIAFHRLAAGYGAAAFESLSGENRRRADRRNPFAARAIGSVERRSTKRRMIDAACEAANPVMRRERPLSAARLEAI